MSKRLQVLLDPKEFNGFQHLARELGVSLGEWVRQSLRQAAQRSSHKSPREKLESIRRAGRLNYPSGEIETMLGEIEKGYLA